MLLSELFEAKVPSVRDQIIADVRKHGGSTDEYFVRFTDFEKLGFSANQGFGQTPDVDDPEFDVDYIGMGQGRRALWFYPLATYLQTKDAYASDKPYAWLVRLKPTAWLQTVKRGVKPKLESPPPGKQRVGLLRMSTPPAAIFFTYGFDLIGQYYNYAKRHQRHGEVKGRPEPSFFDRVRGNNGKGYDNSINEVTFNYGIGASPGKLVKVGKDGRVPHAKLHVNVPKKTALKLGIPHTQLK